MVPRQRKWNITIDDTERNYENKKFHLRVMEMNVNKTYIIACYNADLLAKTRDPLGKHERRNYISVRKCSLNMTAMLYLGRH